MPSDFVSWVRSPERTQEELITVERITEMAVPLWCRPARLALGLGLVGAGDCVP